jgi:uncharacterized protein YidB (DUF937 family)
MGRSKRKDIKNGGQEVKSITGDHQRVQIVRPGDDSSIGGKNGLTEVLASLQSGGLGEIAQSWLSQGPNQRVSADQLGSVLGDDVVAQFGQRAGVGAGDAGSVLAGILPELVNQMSPKGQAPDSPDLGNLLGGLLKGLS